MKCEAVIVPSYFGASPRRCGNPKKTGSDYCGTHQAGRADRTLQKQMRKRGYAWALDIEALRRNVGVLDVLANRDSF